MSRPGPVDPGPVGVTDGRAKRDRRPRLTSGRARADYDLPSPRTKGDPVPRLSRRRTRGVVVPAALGVLLAATAGCVSGTEPGGSRLPQAESWSDVTGGPANRSMARSDLADRLDLVWSRPLGAPLVGTASSPALDWSYQATVSERGCNFFALSDTDGRKLWCSRLATAGPRITATVDGRGTTFLPQTGGVVSVSDENEIRWFAPTEGTPTTIVLLDNRHLLTVTQFGVVEVFNTHTGLTVASGLRLAGVPAAVERDHGLPWCAIGTRGCPAPGPAAVDTGRRTAYLTVWTPGRDVADLVAVRFDGDAEGRLTELWREPLPDGRTGTPVALSPDGDRVFLHTADGDLQARATADGAPLWTEPVGFVPDFSPAVLDDGTLVTGGRSTTVWRGPSDEHPADAGPAPVVAVADRGDTAEVRWRRDDLRQLANPVATPSGRVVVATRGARDRIVVHVLDGADGHTTQRLEVPDSHGPVAGLSVDAEGNLTVSAAMGTIYLYHG